MIEFIKDLRKKTLPIDKMEEVKTDIIAYYIIRPLGDILTYPALKMKISATTVTKFSLLWIILMFLFFMLGDTSIHYTFGFICLFIWDVLDAVDGNIARYTDTCSTKGGLWDATVGWLATYVFFVVMGIVAFREASIVELSFIPKYQYIILGSFAGFCLIFPRLIMHKKAGLETSSSIREVKDRQNYGILKKIIFNIDSVNGFAFIIFVISMLLKITNLCVLGYFILNLAIAVGMAYKLLK